MTDQDYIKAGVGLADGWEIEGGIVYPPFRNHPVAMSVENPHTPILDALAAQLVRQVDALDNLWVCIEDDRTSIQHDTDGTVAQLLQMEKPDRTLNTIKAIVDSGALT